MPPTAHRPARTITVLNLKGGVGKTHTVWLLAAVCQEVGRRILVVDLDAQGNLTNSLLTRPDTRPGVEAFFDPSSDATSATLVRQTRFEHIDLIPAGPRLSRFDLSDQKAWERSDLHLSLQEAVRELRSQYDLIVFDCPPRLSLASFAALCASDGVVIPMEAADWGAQGIVHVNAAIEYVQKRQNPNLRLLGYLVSRFKHSRVYQQSYLKILRDQFGKLAFDTVVPDLAAFEKSVTDRLPITLHSPRSDAAQIARRFFSEVCERAERFSRVRKQSRSAGILARIGITAR
jgi:chromosome partitioning protein